MMVEMVSSAHILVIDDDASLRVLLRKFLNKHGYRVSVAESIAEARIQMQMFIFDLLVVDVMLPDETGVEFTAQLRGGSGNFVEVRDVPVLMLTAKGESDDRISGLQAGADDYLLKPFEPQELVLRIEAILRRVETGSGDRFGVASEVRFGDWVFDLEQKRLCRSDGAAIYLTSGETDLLYALAKHSNMTVSRADILHYSDSGDMLQEGDNQRGIDVQIMRLRRKFESDPSRPQYLMTVRNKGYLLRVDR